MTSRRLHNDSHPLSFGFELDKFDKFETSTFLQYSKLRVSVTSLQLYLLQLSQLPLIDQDDEYHHSYDSADMVLKVLTENCNHLLKELNKIT